MFFRPTTFSMTNMLYLISAEIETTESSSHRIDRSHEIYHPIKENCFLCWLNATSNIRVQSGTILKLYSPSFYENFYGV